MICLICNKLLIQKNYDGGGYRLACGTHMYVEYNNNNIYEYKVQNEDYEFYSWKYDIGPGHSNLWINDEKRFQLPFYIPLEEFDFNKIELYEFYS